MPTKRCCCDSGCILCTDDFNRPYADPPNGRWTVIAPGEWEISSNVLNCNVEGPIISTCQPPPSSRVNTEYSVKIYFKCIDATSGSSFGIIVGYINSTTFYWVELNHSGSSLHPKFYFRSGGSDSLLMDITTHPGGIPLPIDTGDNTLQGKICFSENDWTLDVAVGGSYESGNGLEIQGSETPWTLTGTGGLASLATPGMVGFLKGQFDNFAFHQHWEAKAKCDYCSCMCRNPLDIDDYKQLPECLLCTFVPLFDPSTYPCSLNGATITLTQGRPVTGLSPRKYVWSSFGSGFNTPTDLEAFFYCLNSTAGDPMDRFRLCLKIPSLSGTYTFGSGETAFAVPCGDVSNIVCDPLSMDFGELGADYTTCEIVPGVGPQGVKSALCGTGTGCLPDTLANRAFVSSLRWKVVVTECP